MVANDVNIFLKTKNKGQLSADKSIIKYGKTEQLHKQTAIDAFWLTTVSKIFSGWLYKTIFSNLLVNTGKNFRNFGLVNAKKYKLDSLQSVLEFLFLREYKFFFRFFFKV